MNFEIPGALWGLVSVVLLLIFSLWRQSAAKVGIPSVLLWKKIPERNPPLRALRRPRWRLDLLFQALAVAAAVAALAGPFVPSSRAKPRKVAIVLDTSARMLAGGRLEKAKDEVRRLCEGKLPGDEVAVFAAAPEPRRLGVQDIPRIEAVHERVDVETLLAAARREAAHVILVSDRAPAGGGHALLLGGPGGNAGIVELAVSDQDVFVRGVNHGPPRNVGVRFKVDERAREETFQMPSGVWTWPQAMDGVNAKRVSVELVADDPFPLDDTAHAVRLGPARTVVSVAGRGSPALVRACAAVSGVLVRQDGGDGDVAVGFDAVPNPKGRLRVWVHSPAKPVRLPVEVAQHPLTEGLTGRGVELGEGGVGELPPAYREGRALFRAGGVLVGVHRGREVHLSFNMEPNEGWPARASFPIFWANVVDFAREGAGGWIVFRTGRPVELPAESRILGPAGEESGPSRIFLGHAVGEYRLRNAGGEQAVTTCLLDDLESDVAGMSKPLDWDPGDPAEREPLRRALAGPFAGGALLFILLAWLLQRRVE